MFRFVLVRQLLREQGPGVEMPGGWIKDEGGRGRDETREEVARRILFFSSALVLCEEVLNADYGEQK